MKRRIAASVLAQCFLNSLVLANSSANVSSLADDMKAVVAHQGGRKRKKSPPQNKSRGKLMRKTTDKAVRRVKRSVVAGEIGTSSE
jgi:hypothetical protein